MKRILLFSNFTNAGIKDMGESYEFKKKVINQP